MTAPESRWSQAAFYLACASALASLVSVAACHILMAMALAAVLVSGERLRFPPILLPLAVFAGGTLLSLLCSADPAAGRPQLRKFYVFLILLVVSSTVRHLRDARRLTLAVVAVASASALVGLVQFYQKVETARQLGRNFYEFYMGERLTGFMSHWMTFSGQMLIALLTLAAFLFFAVVPRRALPAWLAAAGVVSATLVLTYTRSIWLAGTLGGLYLLWCWRRWSVCALPAVAALALWLGPASLRERAVSVFRPNTRLDSNLHREVLRATGWRMILAHPLAGVGPEMVGKEFLNYVPPEIPRPLPSTWWYGHLHNIYLHYAAERGIPALLGLLWMLGKVFHDFLSSLRRLPKVRSDERFLLKAGVAVILGILVGGWYELNLGDTEVLTLFLVMVALGYVAVESRQRGEAGIA